MPSWRSKLHTLSHSAAFLWKCCSAIILASLVIGLLSQSVRGPTNEKRAPDIEAGSEEWVFRAKETYSRLEHPEKPAPDALAKLIRMLKPGARDWTFDDTQLRYGDLDLGLLIQKHVGSSDQKQVFANFIRCRLLDEGVARQEAAGRLHVAASQPQPVRFANEFEADLLMTQQRRDEALGAYIREGSFADAHFARSRACSVALLLEDKSTLRRLSADSNFAQDMNLLTLFHVASILDDRWMLLRAVALLQWQSWTGSDSIPLALLAAAVWYLILVYSASQQPWRWLRYLPAVLGGVLSVSLLHWWQGALHYGTSPEHLATPTHEIFHWVMYVGIPEETVKLCFFLPFLPFLLRNGSASKAALTAGCVGLGFAFDENLGYFSETGGAVAVGRFATANFMHIALTGIIGERLYELVRFRFHTATEFLVAFIGVAAAHGLYDFASTDSARSLGVDMLGIVILALAARFYLGRLRPEDAAMRRRTISSTSVFCIGSALMTGAAILLAVDQADSIKGAVSALRDTVAILPVALIYIREFREM